MKITVDVRGLEAELRSAVDAQSLRVALVVDEELARGTEGLKEEMRDRTFAVLGPRVAGAWQAEFYPNKGDARGPAGLVYSKAARIIDFWRAERVVTPIGAAFAIPVNPVIKRGGRAMTPVEVEAYYNQELQARPIGRNIGLFLDLVQAKSGRGYRQATKGRLAQGRRAEPVLMFVLVRTLRSRKLIDLAGPANRWGDRTARQIEQRLEQSA